MEQDQYPATRVLSQVLRHKPEAAGIRLDEHGWADVEELLKGMPARYPLDRETLALIVRTDEKQRYSFSEDGRRIRANQGHSVPVDVELEVAAPPAFLWHGTGAKYADAIDREGLLPQSRLYVHLSRDEETALQVGRRHGSPVLYRVDSGRMQADGIVFRLSRNGIWLVKAVPPGYLERMPGNN